MTKETRIHTGKLELRASESGDLPTIRGYAAVFNRDSEPIAGMFIERIAPGAFARALGEKQDVRALVDHDPSRILGRSTAGTLRLAEDSTGLAIEIDPPNTTAGRDIVESLRRRDVSQMSFGFIARKEQWEDGEGEGGLDVRTVLDADLFDVSAVTYPAYLNTEIAVRSHEHWRASSSKANGLDAVSAKLISRNMRLRG